jgi:hypothetical protein
MRTVEKWAQAKRAGWGMSLMPTRTVRPAGYTDYNAQRMLDTHFPYREGRRTIMEAQNLSLEDRVGLMDALTTSASADTGAPQSVVRLGDFLPAAAGAGLGLLGSALIAPLFTLSDPQKKYFGIGSAALGAVLNTMGRR